MTFREWWLLTLGPVPPLGQALRSRLTDRWLRLHTLPLARRYPDDESAWAEVVRRQRAVAAEVMPVGDPCWLVVPRYGQDSRTSLRVDELPGLDLGRAFEQVVGDDTVTFFAVHTAWDPEQFKVALHAIAEDRFRALWASVKGEVFHPYDGGVDLILRSSERVDELRTKFAGWLSTHPAGL